MDCVLITLSKTYEVIVVSWALTEQTAAISYKFGEIAEDNTGLSAEDNVVSAVK